MNDAQVPENIARARPSCILNLDNEHLSEKLAIRLNGKVFIIFK